MKDQTNHERPHPAPPATKPADSPPESPGEQFANGEIDLDEYARRIEEQADEIARRDLALPEDPLWEEEKTEEEEEIEAVG